MTEATHIHSSENEAERVRQWRKGELEKAGFDPETARLLAEAKDDRNQLADLHKAVKLITNLQEQYRKQGLSDERARAEAINWARKILL